METSKKFLSITATFTFEVEVPDGVDVKNITLAVPNCQAWYNHNPLEGHLLGYKTIATEEEKE